MFLSSSIGVSYSAQRGFLMPLALFVIVVLGGLTVVAAKEASQSIDSYILGSISTQAFYAAETGAQAGLYFLLNETKDRQNVDLFCAAMNVSLPMSSSVELDGFGGCTIAVSCSCRYENNTVCDGTSSANYTGASATSHSFYAIDSQSQCGTGDVIAQRRVEVGASL